MAVSLGIAADGNHAGTCPVAVDVGEDWRSAEAWGCEGSTGPEGASQGRHADAADGEEVEGISSLRVKGLH